LVAEEQLSEMLKRIKIHNKELYMINETIIEAENYFKLLGANLIGRDRDDFFRTLLEQVVLTYKTNKREKPSVRMLDKAQESLQLDSLALKLDNKKNQIRFEEGPKDSLKESGKESSSMGRLLKRGSIVSHF
jgi:ATP-dependent protease HslVU (ClpYQ) ATPase subunit